MCDLEILDCLDHVAGELGQDHCDLLLGLHFVGGLKYRRLEVGQVGSFHGGWRFTAHGETPSFPLRDSSLGLWRGSPSHTFCAKTKVTANGQVRQRTFPHVSG